MDEASREQSYGRGKEASHDKSRVMKNKNKTKKKQDLNVVCYETKTKKLF